VLYALAASWARRIAAPLAAAAVSGRSSSSTASMWAAGDYVACLTDKMVVFPHALSDADAVITASGADIVNWACVEYVLDDVGSPRGSGTLVEEFEFLSGQSEAYDPIAELRVNAAGARPREEQSTREFVLGKLLFGCFSRQLIDRIPSRCGTVFGGATHDYSAMVQALSVARTCVMLNAYEAIFFSLPRDQSLGSATATEPQRGLQYYRTFTHPIRCSPHCLCRTSMPRSTTWSRTTSRSSCPCMATCSGGMSSARVICSR